MHASWNTVIWATGLALQVALVWVLVGRGVARKLPCFTVLIGFYAVRSAALFAVSGHLTRAALGTMYDGLSLIDLLLQAVVVVEMAAAFSRQRGGWRGWDGGVLAGLAGLAAAAGWAAGAVWQPRGRATLDRGQMAMAVLFVLLFAWAAWKGVRGTVRREVEGFAVYSVVSGAAQVGRYRATLVRDAARYVGWSYALAGVYLLVVVFWLVTMRRRAAGETRRIAEGGVEPMRAVAVEQG